MIAGFQSSQNGDRQSERRHSEEAQNPTRNHKPNDFEDVHRVDHAVERNQRDDGDELEE